MTTYGQYEASPDPLYRGILVSVYPARPAGSTDDYDHAVKIFEPDPAEPDEAQSRADIARFVDRVRPLKQLAEAKAKHWIPVHDSGASPSGAFYVTDLFARKLDDLIISRVKLDGPALHNVCESICLGLRELRQTSGRSHGELKPANVMITDAQIAKARVLLADPAPASKLATELDDLKALGRIIYTLVFFQEFRELGGWPITEAPEWARFGKNAEGWRALCNALLNPNIKPGELTVTAVLGQLKGLSGGGGATSSGGGSGKLILGGIAALLLVGGGAGVYFSGILNQTGQVEPSDTDDPSNGNGNSGNGTASSNGTTQQEIINREYDEPRLRAWVLQSIFVATLLDETASIDRSSDPFSRVRDEHSAHLFPDLDRFGGDGGENWQLIGSTRRYQVQSITNEGYDATEWFAANVLPVLPPSAWPGASEISSAGAALQEMRLPRIADALNDLLVDPLGDSSSVEFENPADARNTAETIARIAVARGSVGPSLDALTSLLPRAGEARRAMEDFDTQAFSYRVAKLFEPMQAPVEAGGVTPDTIAAAADELENRIEVLEQIVATVTTKVGEFSSIEFDDATTDLRRELSDAIRNDEDPLDSYRSLLAFAVEYDSGVVIADSGNGNNDGTDTDNGTVDNGTIGDATTDPNDTQETADNTNDVTDPGDETEVVDSGTPEEDPAEIAAREAAAQAEAEAQKLATERAQVRDEIENADISAIRHPVLSNALRSRREALLEQVETEETPRRVRSAWRRVEALISSEQEKLNEFDEMLSDVDENDAKLMFQMRRDTLMSDIDSAVFETDIPDQIDAIETLRAEVDWLNQFEDALEVAVARITGLEASEEILAALRDLDALGNEPFASEYAEAFEGVALTSEVRSVLDADSHGDLLTLVNNSSLEPVSRWIAWRSIGEGALPPGDPSTALGRELSAFGGLEGDLDASQRASAREIAEQRWEFALRTAASTQSRTQFMSTLAAGRSQFGSDEPLEAIASAELLAIRDLLELETQYREGFRAERGEGAGADAFRGALDELRAAGGLSATQIAWLDQVIEAANADAGDLSGGGGLNASGPASAGWTFVGFDDDVATYSRGARQLRFALARKQNGVGSFLSQEEVSVGLFRESGASSSWAKPADRGAIRTWIPFRGQVQVASRGWFNEPTSDVGQNEEKIYPPGFQQRLVPTPNADSPFQSVPGDAAQEIAGSFGCRLPTLDEWRAALSTELARGGNATWNLRDATWQSYAQWVRDCETGVQAHRRRIQPTGSIALWGERGIYKVPQRENEFQDRYMKELLPASNATDGAVWFEPVTGANDSTQRRGSRFTHLIGNVAEYVTENGTVKVVGGSALSDPQLHGANSDPGSWQAFPVLDEIFQQYLVPTDVGIRLAFDAKLGRDIVGEIDTLFARAPLEWDRGANASE